MGWRALIAAGLCTGGLSQTYAYPAGGATEPNSGSSSVPTMVERWEVFAENRGYRLDFDDGDRILTVSDEERFEIFKPSEVVISRTLKALAPLIGEQKEPLVILRATNDDDAETARVASEAFGFGHRVFVFIETGTLTDRRAVDARLAEAVVRAELKLFAPQLGEWIADGIASTIAEDVTGRAMIDGEAVTMKEVVRRMKRAHRKDEAKELDVFKVSGRWPHEETQPMEAESMCIAMHLLTEHEEAVPKLIDTLGHTEKTPGVSTSSIEARELERAMGKEALVELKDVLRSR